jgi:hypothetical protein
MAFTVTTMNSHTNWSLPSSNSKLLPRASSNPLLALAHSIAGRRLRSVFSSYGTCLRIAFVKSQI